MNSSTESAQDRGPLVTRQFGLTGATGFVGRVLIPLLESRGAHVRRLVRSHGRGQAADISKVRTFVTGPLEDAPDLRSALMDVTTLIHLAGRAHVMRETAADAIAAYRATNVEGTRNLAEAAADAGVQRLIFISSIKVNGERTSKQPFRASDEPNPEDAYGVSKAEAEAVLQEVSARTGLEICIIRPPLVYGPGVKGNFARLIRAVEKGVPLPLAAIDNARSMVYVENLCDLIVRCSDHPAAAGRTFLVADDEALSTPELLRRIGQARGKPARLLHVPQPLLKACLTILGRQREYERLADSLVVDTTSTREALDWSPPVSMAEGLRRTVGR